jgi:hypothetical protein
LQEGPPFKPDAFGVGADPPFGFGVSARHGLGQWHRAKLAMDVGSTLTGSGPRKSLAMAQPPCRRQQT